MRHSSNQQRMHRRCLYSSLSHSVDTAKRNYLSGAHSASFSSSFSPSSSIQPSRPDIQYKSRRVGKPSNAILPQHEGKRKWRAKNPATKDTKPRPNIPTPVRGLRPMNIKKALKQDKQTKLAIEEEAKVPEDVETGAPDDAGVLIGEFMPGTFVELRRNNKATEAIVLCEFLQDSSWAVASLASNGELLTHLRTDVHFAVPNIISADCAARCGTERTAQGPQELNARIEALKQIRILSIQAEQAAQGSRMWDRQKLINIYDEVKSHDPTRWAEIALQHATALIYTEPGFINYYATHKYLMDRPLRYVAAQGYLQTQTFAVRPQRDIEEILQVEEWIKKYRTYRTHGPYKKFVEKASRVVKNYDSQPTVQMGPMTQEKADFTWDDSDQVFLRFLLRSLQQRRSNQLDPYEMGRHTIMKDIIPRGPEITDSLIHETVVKLGIISPWQDLYALSLAANPMGDLGTPFPMEAESTKIFNQSLQSKPTAGSVLGPFDFHPSDPLDSIRHDFGDARVFVVDDPTAQELDDGVSLERIPSEPQNHWVHIHIADPARHLHPGHALCHVARKQSSSLYLTSGHYPMFPRALMHDSKFAMSLTDTSTSQEPNRVLTFSVKLDSNANILDYKLRAGLLRNVRKTSYHNVDFALGIDTPQNLHPFGGSDHIQKGPPLSESDVADLRILYKLAHDQVLRRYQANIFVPSQSESDVIFKTLQPTEIQSPCLQGSKFRGFPEMDYTVSWNALMDRGARNLVSEMMKLAGRVASRVATDHNVPIIRRAMDAPILGPEIDLPKLLSMRDSKAYVPYQDYIKFGAESPPGRYTLSPNQHSFLAIPEGEGYTRSTSPLRRYLDLVAHWQLHHILLGPNAPRRPPFDIADLEKLVIETAIQDVKLRKLHKANNYFYSLMYMKRYANASSVAGKLPLENPLSSMRAWAMRAPRKTQGGDKMVVVKLPDYGIHAYLKDFPPDMEFVSLGKDIRVKLKGVDLGLRRTALYVNMA